MSEATQEQALDLDEIEARSAAAIEGPWFKDDVEGEIRVYPTRLLRSVHTNAEGEINVWDSPRTWRPEEMILETEVESWDEGENAQDDKVRANAEFIAHAREDVPALVAEVKRLRSAQVVPQPDREALVKAIRGVAEHDPDAHDFISPENAADAVLAALSPAPLTINRDVRERAAFAVYRLRYPESNAESFETVGLPIVLACREMVDAVIAHLSAQTVEGEGR